MKTTKEDLEKVVQRITDFATLPQYRQTDFLAYALSQASGFDHFDAKQLQECFSLLNLRPYTRLPAYLTDEVSKKTGKYIKHTTGYRLERGAMDDIRVIVESEPKRVQVSKDLFELVQKLTDSQEKSFAQEALNCFGVEAYRATVVMVWSLAIDHLQKYIFGKKLQEFNAAVSSHSDKKMTQVVDYDDFSNFRESRLIELMRSANIITNDVRKLLVEKLGTRNSAGHPSGITISGHKTTEFCLDLIENILLKY